MAFIIPLWAFRLLTLSLIIFAMEGHAGFGSWEQESDYHHYIHHSKFNWNYGNSPMWDHLMGTNYKQNNMETKNGLQVDVKQTHIAEVQALMVGALIAKDFKGGSS